MQEIFQSFPELSDVQRAQFEEMTRLYPKWNEKINVISRKDISNLCINHILHSLAIAKFIRFTPESRILDIGTGGGFPGIPLAVLMPEVKFHLVDRIAKKLRVASDIAEKIGLTNVTFQHGDIGECHENFDFVVSRAVMPQPDLLKIVKKNFSNLQRNAIPNGLITLKGGDIAAELGKLANVSEVIPVSDYFSQPFFDTKMIVYTPNI
ncbi:MAG: 16S rRNA (guanine(527)-N(7))-methyltransferase RsmG [Muribaculaceae bacterium]|nr:16S rRNA (guanine(527)-N(7))-methyltransferase RsmG [Muribaculaceae bacterium]MDE6558972.1 16S rRNA (guanine(527)-N(7))-methyltransferase RsmG [Muribaculaceae bacterium]